MPPKSIPHFVGVPEQAGCSSSPSYFDCRDVSICF
jgi:hypothetical protein